MPDNVSKLVGWIGKKNIAEDIEDDVLKRLALRVTENYTRDINSMSEWCNDIDEGQRIAKQDTAAKSQPWEGASNFKSTLIESASIAFGDRASAEILRGKNIVKTEVIGNDPNGQKKASGENVTDFMSWQLNHQMTDWRDKQEGLLYEIPAFGTVFKKVYFCPIAGVNKSDVLHYPDYVVNQSCSSMEECRAFSIPMGISKNEAMEKQRAGLWLDVELHPENAEGDEGSNEEQEVIHSIDNDEKFIEQACFFDLDGDGYEEPYTVTVHEQTCQVVRVVARYDRGNVYVSRGQRIVTLADIKREAVESNQIPDFDNLDLIRISAEQTIVKYDFLKSIDGTFLGRGYYHLLSSLSKGVNGTTNMLLDSGTLATLQGGYLAKGFRKRMGNMRMKPGSYQSTDISPSDLQNGVLPHQFREPSQVLFALNERLNAEAKEFSVNVDLKGTLSPGAPATTTLALIQESMEPVGAIMRRLIRAEGKEFKMLYVLNSKFTDPVLYQKILDNDADFNVDFDLDTMDISPTASAEMSSKMQRIQRAEILVSQAPNIAVEGGDTRPIWENWFDAMGADEMINQVWPDPEQQSEQQKARAQEKARIQARDDKLLSIEIDHKEREITNTEEDTRSKIAERRAKMAETFVRLSEIESKTILNLELAETEQVKNKIDLYTADLNRIQSAIGFARAEIDLDNEERERDENARKTTSPTGSEQPQQRNITGGV